MTEAEIELMRSDNERMHDLLDRRPAMNMGLVEAYMSWNSLCYFSDMTMAEIRQAATVPASERH